MGWRKMKRSTADELFSEYIRKRDGGRCQRCFKPKGWVCLDNSHYFGRAKRAVRFDPDNCDGLCRWCHDYFGANPHEYHAWKLKQLGQDRLNRLVIRAFHGNAIKKLDEDVVRKWCREKIKELDAAGKYL